MGSTQKEYVQTVETTHDGSDGSSEHLDKAAEFLKQAAPGGRQIIVTPEDNKRILRKIDMHLLPILLCIYGLQSLDKTSLSYASVFGLITDTHLVGQQYSWTGSIVYCAQLVMQPLVAYFLVKLPMGKFVAGMVLCWAIMLCGMVGAKNFATLMVTRFFLGAFESAVAPAFIAIVQMWYRRIEQTQRNAAWYAMLGVVNILGSLLAYGLGHINTKEIKPYQGIFLFCGLVTFCFSIIAFIFLPDSPMQAKFLKGDDKVIAVERLRMNQMGVASREWKWEHVREALLDVKTWIWFCLLTTISIPSGGISTFGPLIVKSFGFDRYATLIRSATAVGASILAAYWRFTTILFNMPFGACQIVATLGGAWLATKYKTKAGPLMLLCIPPIIGISMLLALPHTKANRGPLLAGYYLISFYPGISPLIYSWSGQNTGGDTKRKVTTGLLFVGSNAGNILGPHLFTTNDAPGYTRGLIVCLALFILLIVLTLCGVAAVRFNNARHSRMRVSLGKNETIVDLSMETKSHLEKENEAINSTDGETVAGEKGFDDITDLKNEDFVYVY